MTTAHTAVPNLEHHCGSWMVLRISTGELICELFSRSIVERVNQEKYRVQTAAQYLADFNAKVRGAA